MSNDEGIRNIHLNRTIEFHFTSYIKVINIYKQVNLKFNLFHISDFKWCKKRKAIILYSILIIKIISDVFLLFITIIFPDLGHRFPWWWFVNYRIERWYKFHFFDSIHCRAFLHLRYNMEISSRIWGVNWSFSIEALFSHLSLYLSLSLSLSLSISPYSYH